MNISEFCSRVYEARRTAAVDRGMRIADIEDLQVVVSEHDYAALLAEWPRVRKDVHAVGPHAALFWQVEPPLGGQDSLAMTLRVFGLPVRPSRDLTDGTIKVRAEVDA